MAERPPSLELASPEEGLPDLIEVLQGAVERVAEDDRAVALEGAGGHGRRLQGELEVTVEWSGGGPGEILGRGAAAAHASQRVRMGVLKRHVDVGKNLVVAGEHIDQRISQGLRV